MFRMSGLNLEVNDEFLQNSESDRNTVGSQESPENREIYPAIENSAGTSNENQRRAHENSRIWAQQVNHGTQEMKNNSNYVPVIEYGTFHKNDYTFYSEMTVPFKVEKGSLFKTAKIETARIYQNEVMDLISIQRGAGETTDYVVNPNSSVIVDIRPNSLFYDLKERLFLSLHKSVADGIPILTESERDSMRRLFQIPDKEQRYPKLFVIWSGFSDKRKFALPANTCIYSYVLNFEKDTHEQMKSIFAEIIEKTLRNEEEENAVVLHFYTDIFEDMHRNKYGSFCSNAEQLLDETQILTDKIVHVFIPPPPMISNRGTAVQKSSTDRFEDFMSMIEHSRYTTLKQNLSNLYKIDLDQVMTSLVSQKGYTGIYTVQKSMSINDRLTDFSLRAISNSVIQAILNIDFGRMENCIGKLYATHQRLYEVENGGLSVQRVVQDVQAARKEINNEHLTTSDLEKSRQLKKKTQRVEMESPMVRRDPRRTRQGGHHPACLCPQCYRAKRPGGEARYLPRQLYNPRLPRMPVHSLANRRW